MDHNHMRFKDHLFYTRTSYKIKQQNKLLCYKDRYLPLTCDTEWNRQVSFSRGLDAKTSRKSRLLSAMCHCVTIGPNICHCVTIGPKICHSNMQWKTVTERLNLLPIISSSLWLDKEGNARVSFSSGLGWWRVSEQHVSFLFPQIVNLMWGNINQCVVIF